jgi:hypothetical protein
MESSINVIWNVRNVIFPRQGIAEDVMEINDKIMRERQILRQIVFYIDTLPNAECK